MKKRTYYFILFDGFNHVYAYQVIDDQLPLSKLMKMIEKSSFRIYSISLKKPTTKKTVPVHELVDLLID